MYAVSKLCDKRSGRIAEDNEVDGGGIKGLVEKDMGCE